MAIEVRAGRQWPAAAALALLVVVAACGGGPGSQVVRTGVDGATPPGAHLPAGAAGSGTVAVVVVVGGAPVAGAAVSLADGASTRVAVTDRSGKSRFADLAPGRYRLRVVHPGDSTPVCDDRGTCLTATPSAGEARDVAVDAGATVEEAFAF